ncbi:DUF3800 domain-containing protein [Chryseosolibacter indicus]|uniref:DUF3800 domain-containing protein n=1 Tax=Chryseosolibacter indicus TaxID=2782351 RepID=A0ABS5VUL3_9BACT|nr:DUF3800 domain-containing protein [Chryseosolibacter indicus]MBT1704449.1 DUF3800 domain-containing protein [Chryseosolibacter indicus]
MDFEVYCDESGLESLTRKDAHLFTGIGGIWFPAEYRDHFKEQVSLIKEKHKVHGELKWKKVSPRYFDLYKDVIDFFFLTGYLRFRVVLIESSKVDNIKFNNEDAELGFYKFYYQLLHHWIFDFNTYDVFLDLKINRNKGRLKELERVLDLSNLTSDIKQVQGLPSEQSIGIQLADVLTGLVTTKFNKEAKGSAKLGLIQHIEEKFLGKPIAPTSKWDEKFNVFKINLKGGW